MTGLLLLNYMNRSRGIRSWESSKGRLFSFHSQLSQKNLFIYSSENKLDACSSGDPCAVPSDGKMPHVHRERILCHVAHGRSCLGHNSLRACKVSKTESKNYCRKQAQREVMLCFSLCLFFWLHWRSAFTYAGGHWATVTGCLQQTFGGTISVDKSFMTFSLPFYSKTTTPCSSATTLPALPAFSQFPGSFNCGQPHPLSDSN